MRATTFPTDAAADARGRAAAAATAAAGDDRPGVLYLSYDGMLEPLGQSQVVAYLERLSNEFRILLVSHEKPADMARVDRVAEVAARLERAGIEWSPRRYHKRPPLLSTVWDMAAAAATSYRLARTKWVSILHARSVLSAAMLYPAARLLRAKLIVDIRGLWVDERADGGLIARDGFVYRLLKRMERAMLRAADAIVTLTRASAPILRDDPRFGRPKADIAVIPTCADLDLFSPGPPAAADQGFVVGYVGQIGGWYRFDRMIRLFEDIREVRPDARMLVVNRAQHDEIRRAFEGAGVPSDRFEIRAAQLHEVPGQIRRMDVALSVNAENFSNAARAPTKLAEYLGCGVPCLSSADVGDVAEVLETERVGVVVRDFGEAGRRAAVAEMLALFADPELADRCVAAARRRFSLADGVEAYRAIYRRLARA